MKASTKTTLALACAFVTGIGAHAQAGSSLPSEVTFKQSKNNGAKFKGRVNSASSDCVVGRKVKVFRVAPGPNQKIVKTFASESGRYQVEIPMQTGNRLYAVVEDLKTPLGNRCQNDRSPRVKAS